ncbi:MAG: hypothetical protein LQ339_007238 [Xanthoria mediterranea]|nr:MAG: hypothetical protein LQ339_007238 [Xanthoria mediterranea]
MGNDDVRDLAEIVKIWNELDQRSTTRRKDRLIILAILLGLNAGDIVALDVDDQMKNITSSLQSPYVGARFSLVSESSSYNEDNDDDTGPQKSYRLIYEGPLIYGRISPTDSSLSPASYPPIEGAVAMPNDAQCLLDSDLQQTPPLTHRAQSLHMRHRLGLQSPPYVGLLSGIVLAIWLTAVAIGTTLIELALFHHPATLPSDKVAPGGFPLAMVGAVVVRAAVFLGLEAHTLYRIVGERAYERWASSFGGGGGGGVHAERLFVRGRRRDDDDDGVLLIQYRPWWVVLVILVAAAAMLVVGTQFAVMVWPTVPGAALLLETGVRVWVEVVWVWTSVGRVGRRVRLRWVPWLAIPVRAY